MVLLCVCVCVLHGLFIFSVILQHVSLETEDSALCQITIEARYKNRVTQQLQEIKNMLCQLFPLNFRCVRKYLLQLIYIPDQTEIHSYFVWQLLFVTSRCYSAARVCGTAEWTTLCDK